jgi:predicted nucleic acid-binding protein
LQSGDGTRDALDEHLLAGKAKLLRQTDRLTLAVLGTLVAAEHYRRLRKRGVTVRKTIDVLIGAYCARHGHALLHADRDFDPMVQHLGLRLLQ